MNHSHESNLENCGYNISSRNTAEQEIALHLSIHGVRIRFDHRDLYPVCEKYSTVRGEGYFECNNCNFKWLSNNTTIKLDLYKGQLLKKYRQRCWQCGSYWALPCFRSREFEKMMFKAVRHMHDVEEYKMLDFDEKVHDEVYGKRYIHNEPYCERCIELDFHCRFAVLRQDVIDKSPVYSIFRQLSHAMACYIQKHSEPLHSSLEDLFVKINIHIDDQCGFIHLVPTERSIGIVHWNKLCEEKLELFLDKLNSVSLSIQPEMVCPKLQEITKEVNSKASLCLKEQTFLQIVGFREEVEGYVEFVKKIKATEYKQKNCIIPF